ncbi:MAG: ribonuclease R [Candidatus Marinimicrobia bacterium]|nr:ribonuclease R [Candidatus Neomarinimicrobiota bacterium]MCF7880220.1 ribonuclease R [Candidatus Neomarinimicrobiota bacterium]
MSRSGKEIREEVIGYLKNRKGKTFKPKDLSQSLNVPRDQYRDFKQWLKDLSDQGKIERFRKNTYGYPQEKQIVEGKLSVTSKGFGFVLVDEGSDIFIGYDNLKNAMDGDVVKALVFRKSFGKNPEGKVLDVLERTTENIVGIYHEDDVGGHVVPEDDRLKSSLYIPPEKAKLPDGKTRPKDGQIVVAHLEDWADPKDNPQGYIVEILGFPGEKKMDLKIVAKSKELDLEFPQNVEQSASDIPEPDWKHELKRRVDLRDQLCFTIDPEDAKDFDDAVSFRQLSNGRFELGVHIADVSYFVNRGSTIDKEAWERGTSVYFVRHVIPMLPERLSNELCSLRPNEDKLAFSVIMEMDSSGQVHDYSIRESVIRSDHRFSYEEVEEIIKGKDHEYADTIHLMQMMSQALQREREDLGSIDFDIPEPIFSLDENGVPYEVRPSERLHAHRLIEEFMLRANRTVAQHIAGKNTGKNERWPFVYRVHENPPREDIEAFLTLLKNLGITYHIEGKVEPEDYRHILEIVENLEFKDFIEKVALRSMTKAKYSPENLGHFGLAFDKYTHFTSPIRRYPDLVVHRLLKQYIEQGKPQDPDSLEQYLEETCVHSSERERNAMEAEREYAKIKSMEFLAQKVGETFDGIISGITSFGAFVELTHYLVEGLVPMSRMDDDYYEYDKDNYRLVGRKTGKRYRLGDRVRVKVHDVSVDDREAVFIFLDTEDA